MTSARSALTSAGSSPSATATGTASGFSFFFFFFFFFSGEAAEADATERSEVLPAARLELWPARLDVWPDLATASFLRSDGNGCTGDDISEEGD